jgi:hypothetical protein
VFAGAVPASRFFVDSFLNRAVEAAVLLAGAVGGISTLSLFASGAGFRPQHKKSSLRNPRSYLPRAVPCRAVSCRAVLCCVVLCRSTAQTPSWHCSASASTGGTRCSC